MPESTSEESDSITATPPPDVRLRAVQVAQAAGIAVMPLVARQKKPAKPGWQKEPMPTEAEAEAWAQRANIGFRTGVISGGLFVIDLDPGAQISDLGELPATVTVLTGRTDAASGQRGKHLYFRSTIALSNSTGRLGGNIDTRGDGGFVVAPGSIHPDTGLLYEFAPGLGIGEVEIAELPQHIAERLGSSSVKASAMTSFDSSEWIDQVPLELRLEAGRILVANAEPGVSGASGHAATFKVACGLSIRCGLPPVSVLELMQEFNEKCVPRWSPVELEHKCAEAAKRRVDSPARDIGTGLAPLARVVVEAMGISVQLAGSDFVVTNGTAVEKFRGGKSDKCTKRLLLALTKLLPQVPKTVLAGAAESFASEPPVTENDDLDPDVFLISAKRLAETSPDIRAAAKELSLAPDLLDRIGASFNLLGLVGLSDQAAMHYLAATSRIALKPIYILVRGERCTGKSFLGGLTGRMMPSECVRIFSEVTSKALLYLPGNSVKHRLIISGERTHEAKDSLGGSTQILRELLSEGKASQFSVDGGDGGRVGVERVVEGPIGFIQSTTSDHIFAEDLSRMYQVWIAPSDADRKAIGERMLRTAQGLDGFPEDEVQIIELHHCFQRMLLPREVLLPRSESAAALLEMWPTSDVDHSRKIRAMIELVKTIALVYQFQRETDSQGRVIATEADIDLAKGLMSRMNLMEDKAVFGDKSLENLRKIFALHENREFTAADLTASFECSQRTIRRWLARWCETLVLRCAKEATSTNPASFVITPLGKASLAETAQKAVTA